ncbi:MULTISPECIES: CDP-diacylglycerol--serine O-phosphatidyltransferase [Vibrio]|uniref:CDP-diacylglycerol--serine O-phosphatidyltransferase n=1 Tax=Vibrio kanaloae TaxID=170673 RepID=A0A4U1W8J9_9VIBR|nr:CDP-diacylglycerol--serine O-phosphatidyltransferase [Vibrio kanaloae]MCG9557831.1 CDP-diacylglycerol--serine O-phosphatidyltransferase [Vibrio kanaloae]NOJ02079.1 CDP-diacylglycerol--serine O-phosphatidyltransferase [Vibrio kanaloae]OEF12620.1 phosphatidylserine synthase [Vibrio kanaloae 5S-149]TKE89436.1 CDP-diacylglycerol--serine O-phosphatidyltransferase [Vibrio kanaloae]TKF11521.1 CDP-diacylglycerol--serine O-phosphatidyltransferase [Vibrio kanaloae]
MIASRNPFIQLPTIAQNPDKFEVLLSAQEFRTRLLDEISRATTRISLVALYLEDDEAGREILTALYEAKQKNPELNVSVCVDWHRAQRGLIGAESSEGNAAMYKEFAEKYQHSVPVYGIPVRGKEVFGVLHLKGFIIDDSVIYSGASLNNIYLNYHDRYRFDRYHVLNNAALADSMFAYVHDQMVPDSAVYDLADKNKPITKELKPTIRQFRASLARSQYKFDGQDVSPEQVAVTPLVGIGKRRNRLNQGINQLIAQAKDEIFICTPYFNFPPSLAKEVKKALKRGVKVSIVVGDKTANDFFISPEEEFKTIGGLPYLYELNLRRFAKANEANIASRNLSIRLWKHDSNSFHLKGIWVDKRYMLLTGSNLNPRAWKLDLENGIFIQDNYHHLTDKFQVEVDNILQHTQLICTYKQLDKIDSYPLDVQKLLRKITRVKADRVLKQIL